jgi:hypothetical protein
MFCGVGEGNTQGAFCPMYVLAATEIICLSYVHDGDRIICPSASAKAPCGIMWGNRLLHPVSSLSSNCHQSREYLSLYLEGVSSRKSRKVVGIYNEAQM